MKKHTKIIALILCIIMSASTLFSCNFIPGGSTGGDQTEEKLSAPKLTLDGSSIRWSIVDGADSFNIYVNGELKANVNAFRYTLATLKPGTYSVYVAAVNGETEGEKSNEITYVKNEAASSGADTYTVALVEDALYDYNGFMSNIENLVISRQLKDEELWAGFVEQFRYKIDSETGKKVYYDEPITESQINSATGGGWRGEFWGKLMMGAARFYEQTGDEELYAVLEYTVRDILTTQTEDGRISSYGRLSEGGNEFCHWDMWCRKYVIMGMQNFYDICKDEALKAELLDSMLAQFDYIRQYVGPEENKIDILETGKLMFGGIASSSSLEAFVRLYEMTGEQRVLDFAMYIAETGGSSTRNQLEAALANEGYPYQWGAPKAYEFCSYFVGLLDLYMLTGIERYKTAGINVAYKVIENEISVVGGAGYNSEQFNNTEREQANPSNTKGNLEACVTTELTDFMLTAYMITGDPIFIDVIELTMYNALYGAMDKEHHYQHVYTSYFNLMFAVQPTSAGGGQSMPGFKYGAYGCCIAFGPYGSSLARSAHYNIDNDAIYANLYLDSTVTLDSPAGKPVTLVTETTYPTSGTIKITVNTEEAQTFQLKLRIPSWSEETAISVNGTGYGGAKEGEYYTITRNWQDGDSVILSLDMRARLVWGSEECSNENAKYNVAIQRGPLTLARDKRLGENLFQTVKLALDENGYAILEPSNTASFDTLCEFKVKLEDGSYITMIDYASAGGTYNDNSLMTVFMPTTDYWNTTADLSKPVHLVSTHSSTVVGMVDGKLASGGFIQDYTDLSNFRFMLTDRGEGKYTIGVYGSDKVLTGTNEGGEWRFVEADYAEGNNLQLFTIERSSLFTYKIKSLINGQLLSLDSTVNYLHLYADTGSDMQKWTVQPAEE